MDDFALNDDLDPEAADLMKPEEEDDLWMGEDEEGIKPELTQDEEIGAAGMHIDEGDDFGA